MAPPRSLPSDVFYVSPRLAAGRHTLLITNTVDNGWYWLDEIQTLSASPTIAPDPSKPISVGFIAGIAIGGTLIIGIATLVLVMFLRQRRKAQPNGGRGRLYLRREGGGWLKEEVQSRFQEHMGQLPAVKESAPSPAPAGPPPVYYLTPDDLSGEKAKGLEGEKKPEN
ncbi:hypothetical protein NLJ89_g5443 [Agrocybe chaxingu]|uniref:Uncharacterized protein n=1 Tax=Agrocybe chaxingu TaxID=84603 RepID=A0A9W8MWX5_9AGAR|nr:hypothetical protein NLJ89_g5443 [Agrocybe chaxingu]